MSAIKIRFFKHTIFCLIIFSNTCFGKEFDRLFIINQPIVNSSNIEKTINNSFNTMIYRLSGNSSPSNIWKIINAGNSRKDFIKSYTIKNFNDKSYLQVYFDKDLLVKKFNELSIPAIGISRPVMLFLINIDTGTSSPYLLKDSESKSEIDILIKNSLDSIYNKRGIYLELPEPDLEDLNLIASYSKLINSNNLLNSKYASDKVIQIKLTKIGINSWLVDGDIVFEYMGEDFNNYFIKKFEEYLTIEINYLLDKYTIDTSQLNLAKLSIENIYSYDDYITTRKFIRNLVAIKEIDIDSFALNKISYNLNIYGNFDTFTKEITDSNFMKINNIEYSKNKIELGYER